MSSLHAPQRYKTAPSPIRMSLWVNKAAINLIKPNKKAMFVKDVLYSTFNDEQGRLLWDASMLYVYNGWSVFTLVGLAAHCECVDRENMSLIYHLADTAHWEILTNLTLLVRWNNQLVRHRFYTYPPIVPSSNIAGTSHFIHQLGHFGLLGNSFNTLSGSMYFGKL